MSYKIIIDSCGELDRRNEEIGECSRQLRYRL